MNRITQLDPARATGKTKELFDDVQAKLGIVPNVFRVLGNAPAALEGYLNFDAALAGGSFDAKIREQIALAVAESNLCRYCLSAHVFMGGRAGLTEKEIADAARSIAATAKTEAILKLARDIVVQRGEVSDADLEHARTCGLTDGEIVETVANVVLNILANYINHVARTVVDFAETKIGQIEEDWR
ncbi:MAG TPA: carboxymuconolactone decarboxylase family protein [Candidatus Acidoferrales bacterium]|nr:carboxymuconolactone decarboxylase family protein [Candidatus Acidoferrales bacterium]